jgi:hypothetical protein
MPRSTGAFVGKSYQNMLTHIMPSIISGLEMFGMYENLHYFIGKHPPRSWRNSWGRAYMPPERYDHYITFWTGVGIHLISQDVKGDGRGITTDFFDADECQELNKEMIDSNVLPTKSGTNTKALQHSRYFASELYTGTVPLTADAEWFNKLEEDCIINPQRVMYLRATAEDNADNLRPGYLDEERSRAMADWIYLAEYHNIRPKFIKDGFYALLDADIHCYYDYDYSFYVKVGQHQDCRGDRDLVKGHPLIVGLDFGYAINCLTANQHLRSINEYRTLKGMYVLGEKQEILDDLMDNFHQYYQYHQASNPDIYLWYDNTGNIHTGVTKRKRAEIARDYLIKRGWKVRLMTIGGRNPLHDEKYLVWTYMLRGNHPRLPRYRMNRGNCKDLYVAMKNAKAKKTLSGLIQKDKGSEGSTVIPRNEATDITDANDTAIHGMFFNLVGGFGSLLPASAITH